MKKNILKQKNAVENITEETQKQELESIDDTSRRNKRLDMFIGIFSVVCALVIWFYASAISETDIKQQSLVNIKGVVTAENKGYDIEYNSNLKIDLVLSGKVLAVSQIPNYGINAYVDLSSVNLSEITNSKVVQLPLILDLPEGLTCIEKSQEYIEVTITKKSNT